MTNQFSKGPDMPDTTNAAEASLNRGPVDEEYDDAAGFYVDGDPIRDTKAPDGPIDERWGTRQFEAKIANPANRRRLSVIVVGTGLAGASAAATLGEAGYVVKSFCYQDSPRRAHSIAAQGGINAAKNYKGDGDSVYRLFYDTIKGGDYRSRESNVYRLAQVSTNIIDQCVAQGVPFAREYGGLLDNRSFGGVQVSRTFYARGQTGQQLLIGAYQALERQVAAGTVKCYTRHEMVELVVVDGRARGIIVRDLVTGEIETYFADVVVLASGGYGNVFFLSTNAMGCNVTATWRAHRKGAYMANPCYTQIHPTCIPVTGHHQSKLTLMSESLRNDGRIWVPKKKADCTKDPREIPEEDRDYYLERIYPAFGNLVPRDIASRQAKNMCDEGRGVGPEVEGVRRGVYLDFADAIERLGRDAIEEKYGNLFDMYARITGEDPYAVPMRIYPAVHYVMGGLWVDYDLQSTIPGLFVTGEANFSDHGANRLGASALMQGLADGYFVLPNTIRDYLAEGPFDRVPEDHPAVVEAQQSVKDRIEAFMTSNGTRSVDSYHRELGNIMWEYCGMERTEDGLQEGHRPHPHAARRLHAQRPRARLRRQPQPVAGEGRPRRRLPRARRADVHRRAQPARVVRRPLPRRVADRGRRGAAPRRPVRVRRGLGVGRPAERRGRRHRDGDAGPAQGRADLRVRRDEAAELQVMRISLKIWRQADGASKGALASYELDDVSEDMSFLEMLDVLNEELQAKGEEPVAFDSDCREGICGMCGLMINGQAHGPEVTTTCQLHMRSFKDGDEIVIEPWRADAFPVLKDLVRRPRRVRPDHPVRRLHLGQHRRRAGRARHAGARRRRPTAPSTSPPASAAAPASRRAPTAPRRCSSARRSPTSASSRRVRPSATTASSTWSARWTPRASAAAPTSVSARRPAPRRSRST